MKAFSQIVEEGMASVSPFASIENLVRLDIDEAFNAERMLHDLVWRASLLGRLGESDEARGIGTIARALSFNFILVVQQLLRGGRGKATLEALLAAAQPDIGESAARHWKSDLDTIRESADAHALKACRDEFMAHTRIDSSWRNIGIETQRVLGLLIEIGSSSRSCTWR